MTDKLSLSIPEAVALTGLSRTTIYRAIGERRLVARKNGGRTVILRCDLEAFLSALPAYEPSDFKVA